MDGLSTRLNIPSTCSVALGINCQVRHIIMRPLQVRFNGQFRIRVKMNSSIPPDRLVYATTKLPVAYLHYLKGGENFRMEILGRNII